VHFLAGIISWTVDGHVAAGHVKVSLNDVLSVLRPRTRLSKMQTKGRFHYVASGGSDRDRVGLYADAVNVNGLAGPSSRSDGRICAVQLHPLRVSAQILKVELAVISQDCKAVDVGRSGEHPQTLLTPAPKSNITI
jgi:hypothetical protein